MFLTEKFSSVFWRSVYYEAIPLLFKYRITDYHWHSYEACWACFLVHQQLPRMCSSKYNKYCLILQICGTLSFYLLTAAVILKRKNKKGKAQWDIKLPQWKKLQWKLPLLQSDLQSLSSCTSYSSPFSSNTCFSSHQYCLAQWLIFIVLPTPASITTTTPILSQSKLKKVFTPSLFFCPLPYAHLSQPINTG